jgi:hypothetical protein
MRETVAPSRISWPPLLVRCSAFGLGLFLMQVAQRSQPVPRVAEKASVWVPVRVFNTPMSAGPANPPTFAIIVTRAIPAAAAGPVKNWVGIDQNGP